MLSRIDINFSATKFMEEGSMYDNLKDGRRRGRVWIRRAQLVCRYDFTYTQMDFFNKVFPPVSLQRKILRVAI